MLDSDLARLYHCSNGTKTINQAVKRHINRFPERFMFQLNQEEFNNLRSQLGTANNIEKTRTLPYVFTEQGVAMLATVLRTSVAEEVSIKIMDAFVSMRKYIGANLLSSNIIEQKLLEHDKRISLLEKTFDGFQEKTNHIFFDGQIYDAYSKIIDIFKESKTELIVIDSYPDKLFLDMIKVLNCNVILITKSKTKLTNLDIEKYNQQYHNLRIIYDNTFHD